MRRTPAARPYLAQPHFSQEGKTLLPLGDEPMHCTAGRCPHSEKAAMPLQFHFRSRRLETAALVSLACLLTACERAVLDPAGDIARQQRDIIYISTGLMLLIIIPVMILIVVFAWRYRKGGRGTYDPHFDHSTALELAIWSAPLLIIIALGALTWSSTHLLDPFRPLPVKEGTKPLVVQVVSLDWKWLFIYPEEGIATVNELALPVDRPVRFEITSSNMMNTFYAPTLAGMIYAMPGMQSQLHAVLRRPVESEGFSANYSGPGFSDMRFALKGMAEADFNRWVREAPAGARPLALPAYRELLVPSERVPPMRFSGIDRDLFRRIVERCVEPGTPCMSDMMRHDHD
jgi:cytochrome o ubiquinol oxidase subunit 2